MSPAGGCSRTTPPSKYPMGAVSRRPAAELLSLLPSLSAPSGVRLVGYLQLTHGWCHRSRSGGKMGGRAADGVRHPGGSPPGPGRAAGPPLRAVTRLLQPAQVDDGLASSSARAADQRPALTGPRARRWARGVAPSVVRGHGHLRRSFRGRGESVELRSVSRPWRDARCTRARCARFAQLDLPTLSRVKTGLSTRPDGVGHTSLALCIEGDVMGVLFMAASCVRSTLPPLHPHPYSHGASRLRSVGLGRNTRGMRVT